MRLDCGIPRGRLVSWLEDELALPCADGVWTYASAKGDCFIALAPLDRRVLGSFEIDRTEVTFEGAEEAVGELHDLFVLRFMSAGG